MTRVTSSRSSREERGSALILAISVMVVIGVIMTSLFTLITSATNDRTQLDAVRNRQYAADAAIERAVAQVRNVGGAGPGLASCGTFAPVTRNGVTIQVTCDNVPTLTTSMYLQRDVVFTAACAGGASNCPDGTVVIRAQVNYEAASAPEAYTVGDVARTYVQSWSVNR
jgi:type II secretory pathway pseudopilin PulG